MAFAKLLEPLAKKEVTRKEFLTIAALGIASIASIGTIIELVTGKSPKHRLNQYVGSSTASGYGGKSLTSKL